ncbi:MAG TPA: hypothetical protein VGM45_00795 [Gaiellaceae bacterium]
MRRLTAWIAGVAGGVVAYRFWRRRPQAAAELSPEPTTDEQDHRADELRAKLAESRAEDEPSPAEPDDPDDPPEAVDERRQRVHEEGRAALDEMKSDEPG